MDFRVSRRFVAFVLTIAIVLLAGCSGSSAPSQPPTATRLTPTATTEPIPNPTAAPTAPSQAPAATPVATSHLVTGDWRSIPDPASFRISVVERVVSLPDGFVAVGCTAVAGPECDLPAVWTSPDAVAWLGPTLLPMAGDLGETSGSAGAVAGTPTGFAVGGQVRRGDRLQAALWFSADKRSFERVADDASLADAAVVAMTTVGDRFVAVGSDAYMDYSGFRAWSSDDGRAWVTRVAAGSDAAFPNELLALESGLVAWGPTCGVCPARTAWWRSEDGLAWTATGMELSGAFAFATAVGESQRGLVAFGTTGVDPVKPAAWSLADGADRWEPVQPPAQPEGTRISHYLLVGNVAVLAATSSGDPSSPTASPTGLVWLAGPGEDWRPAIQLPGIGVIALLQDPARVDRVVVVGRPSYGDAERFLWTGTIDLAP